MRAVQLMTKRQKQLFDLGRAAAQKQPSVNGTHLVLTGRIEWYTPPEYVEAAREVMGSIDVDPASSVVAQAIVRAKKYYTVDTNGLSHRWSGNVWLNPPYASTIISKFVDKLIAHLDDGIVRQAIMLTHCNTDTRWYHKAWSRCAAFCQTRGRVKFYSIDEKSKKPKTNSPTHGHLFLYFGERHAEFSRVFSRFGAINRPYGQTPTD